MLVVVVDVVDPWWLALGYTVPQAPDASHLKG